MINERFKNIMFAWSASMVVLLSGSVQVRANDTTEAAQQDEVNVNEESSQVRAGEERGRFGYRDDSRHIPRHRRAHEFRRHGRFDRSSERNHRQEYNREGREPGRGNRYHDHRGFNRPGERRSGERNAADAYRYRKQAAEESAMPVSEEATVATE